MVNSVNGIVMSIIASQAVNLGSNPDIYFFTNSKNRILFIYIYKTFVLNQFYSIVSGTKSF